MKKFIFISLLAYSLNAKAQVTLEHTYDSSSTFAYGTPSASSQLMIIKFEISGEHYVKINRWGKTIDIYQMNHLFVKTISLASLPTTPITNGALGDILYISEQLFDIDSKIEFMYCTASPVYIGIYNEDGILLFSDTALPAIRLNVPLQQYPIYNTSMGTKMILSYNGNDLNNFKAKVFSLPGTLSAGIEQANGQLIQMQSGQLSNLYPNPSNGSVTLQYELPKNEKEGELILYNMQGAEVKRYKVDNTFKDILLDNTALPAGTYFYQLQTKKRAVGTKKMVVIK
ncbi:MAG: hypothetical protein A2X08_14080 [Bacteroidetes bacterium GWA2_32_17]|nr:MAG: hypothetical protein A2X08_14080 [Bacteroidetes bacterium GWA2_32_17]